MNKQVFKTLVNQRIDELIQIGMRNIEKIDGTFNHPITGEKIPNIILKNKRLYPFCIAGPDGKDAGVDPRVKAIGQQLHLLGGLEFMQYAYHQIRLKLGPSVRTVNSAWNGIVGWRF